MNTPLGVVTIPLIIGYVKMSIGKKIGDILSMIGNYDYCTVEQYKTAMTQLKADMDAQFDYMIANVDTNLNGKVSSKETGKAWFGFAKNLYKSFRSNSAKYWGKS